jgi:hypothetical protein
MDKTGLIFMGLPFGLMVDVVKTPRPCEMGVSKPRVAFGSPNDKRISGYTRGPQSKKKLRHPIANRLHLSTLVVVGDLNFGRIWDTNVT